MISYMYSNGGSSLKKEPLFKYLKHLPDAY